MISLNPNLDAAELAGRYAVDDRLRINDVLQASSVRRIHDACRDHVPYRYLCHVDGENLEIPPARLAELDKRNQRALQEKILAAAAGGVGFFYSGYQLRKDMPASEDSELAFLHGMLKMMNSEQMLDFVRAVTSRPDLRGADGQFTRYTPGHFLTRHKDDIKSEGRRVAYVLGFTQRWHPDWGGLLQFFGDDGTPRDAWVPGFNTMVLFDVRHVHSVTYVTPFAREPRLSLTGWFHA